VGDVPPDNEHDADFATGNEADAMSGVDLEGHLPARSSTTGVLLCGIGALVIAGLIGLGMWQLHRHSWKLDLIARIDMRIKAPPIDPPGPAAWSSVDADHDAYRHIAVKGVWLRGCDTLVQAVTVRGAGFWVMTPLRTDAGFTVIVNRGFVPADDRRFGAVTGVELPTEIIGLLRITEPGGGFLRNNDPAENRWYSRDVKAIADAQGLKDVAPYFIDDAGHVGSVPVGGLTVISLPNNHLQYALTWFLMALALAGAMAHALHIELSRTRSLVR
jgi:surfeit locus 1 family protein